MIISLDVISWQIGIILLIVVIFIIYLIFGGENHEYIGLSPLEIGFDASRQVEHKEENNEPDVSDENINNTPNLPDLNKIAVPKKKKIKVKNQFYSSNFNSLSSSFSALSISEESSEFSKMADVISHRSDIIGHRSPKMTDIISHQSPETNNTEINNINNENPKSPRTAALGSHKCYNVGKKSKFETLCKQAIEEITGKPFYCVRPNFLKNPETNRNLELDMYNDELKLAVEASGMQHYIYPNMFHKTREEFINQIRRDQFKVDTCDANGIYLITVPYNVPLNLDSIKKYITYYLPENTHMRV